MSPRVPLMPCPWSQTCPLLLDYFQRFPARLASLCIHVSSLYPQQTSVPRGGPAVLFLLPKLLSCLSAPPGASTQSHLRNLEVLIASCTHSKSLSLLCAFFLYPLPPALNTAFVLQGANVRFAEGRLPLAAPQLEAISFFVQHDNFLRGWPSCGSCGSPVLPSSHPLWAFLPLWAFIGPGLPPTLFLLQNFVGLV